MTRHFWITKLPLVFFVLAWLCLGGAAALFVFKSALHSDSLFLDDVFTDLFVLGGHWEDWRLTAAPAYVPDLILYAIAFKILPSPELRIFFVTVVQIFLLGFAAQWFVGVVKAGSALWSRTITILVVAFVTLVMARTDAWLYFNTTNNHFAALLLGIAVAGLAVIFLRQPRALSATLIVLFGAAAHVSTAIYLTSFVVPALIVTVVALALSIHPRGLFRSFRSRLGILVGLFAGGYALSLVVNRFITFNDPSGGRTSFNPAKVGESLGFFVDSIRYAFGAGDLKVLPLTGLVVAAALLVYGPVLRRFTVHRVAHEAEDDRIVASLDFTSWNSARWPFAALAAVAAIALPISMIAAVVSGAMIDRFGFRYFALPVALILLLGVVSIGTLERPVWKRWVPRLAMIAVPVLLITTVASIGPVRKLGEDFQVQITAYTDGTSGAQTVAECIMDARREGIDLRTGIADFWMSRGVRFRLDDRSPIVTMENTLQPWFHMATIGPFLRPAAYPDYQYNYAIVRPDFAAGPALFSVENVKKVLPVPSRVITCANDIEIWYYDDDSLKRVVSSAGELLLMKIGKNSAADIVGALFRSGPGEVDGSDRVIDVTQFLSTQPKLPGAVYDLNLSLSEGTYEADFAYELDGNARDPKFEFGFFGDTNNPSPFPSESASTGRMTFTVGPGGAPVVQLFVALNGGGSVTIKDVRLSKISD